MIHDEDVLDLDLVVMLVEGVGAAAGEEAMMRVDLLQICYGIQPL